MALIEVELEDYLEEIDTQSLVEELRKRSIGLEFATSRQVAQRLRGAFYRRDPSQFEALLVAYLDPLDAKAPAAAATTEVRGILKDY